MQPLSKTVGAFGLILSVLGALSATDTVMFINTTLASFHATPAVQHGIGLALALAGTVVAYYAHAPTATSANAPDPKS